MGAAGRQGMARWTALVVAEMIVMAESSHALPSSSFLGNLASLYHKSMAVSPLATNCLQGAGIAGIGDLCSQVIEREKRINAGRIARASATGVFYNGLLLPYYYDAIQGVIPSRKPVFVLLKVLIDGFLWGFFGNFSLVAVRRYLEGSPAAESVRYAQSVIWPVFKSDFTVWTSYNALCYGVIPRAYQPLSTAVVSAMWSTYISFISISGLEKSQQSPKQ
eukprot:763261-Hanusia_phi.AAC.2